ncbi:Ig-like domain-containing protein [Rhodococcus aetherivorans]|uniref:Ig-like domain-containing protein n=1 Tax=Rhodococcus aetherivorans TaxID=191292 RepID=UPI00388F7854
MANVTFASLKEKDDSLLIVPRDIAVLACPWGQAPIPDKLTDATGLIALPPGWRSAGEISREKTEVGGDSKTESISGYGSLVPRRVIKTEETARLSFQTQEMKKLNLELFHSQDLSNCFIDDNGEWRFYKSSASDIMYWSIILIGLDGSLARPILPYWIFPKMTVGSSGAVSLGMAKELGMPINLDAYEDSDFGPDGAYVAIGQAGLGNLDIAAAAGFAPPVTAITLTPATASVAVAATTTLTVTDQDSNPITSGVAFTSSDPTKATVSAAGVVTGVAAGTSTITAAYQGFTDTCVVTVTA